MLRPHVSAHRLKRLTTGGNSRHSPGTGFQAPGADDKQLRRIPIARTRLSINPQLSATLAVVREIGLRSWAATAGDG